MTDKLTRHPTKPNFEPGHGYTQEDWDEVSDNPESTSAELASAKPFAEVFPQMAATIKRMQGRPRKADKLVAVTLRLSPETLALLKRRGKNWRREAAHELDLSAKRDAETKQP